MNKKSIVLIVSALLIINIGGWIYLNYKKTNETGVVDIGQDKKEMDLIENQNRNPVFAHDANNYFFKKLTSIRFERDFYDFDTIPEGTVINKQISYINEGPNPYFVVDIKASCGCTVPTYTHEPVNPKDTGYVQLEYNSKGKKGFHMIKLMLVGNVKGDNSSTFFKIYVK